MKLPPQIQNIFSFIGSVLERMDKIHMPLIAAGVAFYGMFAAFPGIAAIIAVWSLWFDPAVVLEYMEVAEEFMPAGAAQILRDQITALLSGGQASLGWATVISVLVATVTARAGVTALISGLNAAYGVRSHSTIFGFILAYALTLAIVGVVLLGFATIVVVPVVLALLPVGIEQSWLIAGLPWAAMFIIVLVGIGILYRYGPNVTKPRTPLFTWGSLFAAMTWGAASLAFSAYLSSFNSYNRIYGSIGAVTALLMWFFLAAFSVMLGAILNVELSRRRRLKQARAMRRAPDAPVGSGHQ